MLVPSSASQSIQERHSVWHQCFGPQGNTGFEAGAHLDSAVLNPSGRGASWYAMHRQVMLDFDLDREEGGTHSRVEWIPWFPGREMTYEYPSFGCERSSDVVWRRGNEVGSGVPCDDCVAYPDCLNHRPDQPSRPGACSTNRCSDDPTTYCDDDGDCASNNCVLGLTWGFTPAGEVAIITPDPSTPTDDDDVTCVVSGVAGSSCDPSTISELTSIDQFESVEQVTDIADAWFHGAMHVAVTDAGVNRCSLPPYAACENDSECPSVGPCNGGSCQADPSIACVTDMDCGVCMVDHAYCDDVLFSTVSMRDPMFWRLHKSLDVVVQAWQRGQPSDVVIVLDRSGSMSATDAESNRKFDRAVEAAAMLVDALPESTNGVANRIGVVVYADGTPVTRPMQDIGSVDIEAFTDDLESMTPSGCTSIGGGLEAATALMCGASGCAGTADKRRAIVLLTDGVENVPPCLFNDGGSGSCGSTCNGTVAASNDLYDSLGDAQVCAVGFGESGSLNGDRLTLLAERQGGIYVQNPSLDSADNGTFHDLKVAFAKCLGHATPEVEALDPQGTLEPWRLASEPTELDVCQETSAAFLAGWKRDVEPGAMRVLVTTPSGDLVLPNAPSVETSLRASWSFQRLSLPYAGEQAGRWRAELIRTHRSYVNAFTTDALPESVSVSMVRRQIQRLCPEGCSSVLYFEDQTLGPQSAYDLALSAEEASGLLGARTTATDAVDLSTRLTQGGWDLIVYAHQGSDGAEVYDDQMLQALCGSSEDFFSQRAIVTDTRLFTGETCTEVTDCSGATSTCLGGQCTGPGFAINSCAGGIPTGGQNWSELTGDGRLLEGAHTLIDHGYPRFSYELRDLTSEGFSSEFPASPQAYADTEGGGVAVSAMGEVLGDYERQRWFTEVLVEGVGGLNSAKPHFTARTGDALRPQVSILPAFVPDGGFDQVEATVTIERPTIGVGNLMLASGMPTLSLGGETHGGRAGGLTSAEIASETVGTFVLNDDGVDGDLNAGNYYWSTSIPDEAIVDGMYHYTYNVRITHEGCTTERELRQSVFVDVGTDPDASTISAQPTSGGIEVTVTPVDTHGNPWGPGRIPPVECGPEPACQCDASDVTDHLDGSFTIDVHTVPGTTGCEITGFGVPFEVGEITPAIIAPDLSFVRCAPGALEEELSASTSHGTLQGRIVSVNGTNVSSSETIDGSDPRHEPHAVLPVGTTVIEWTATYGGMSEVALQTATVTLTEDPALCCAEEEQGHHGGEASGQTLIEGTLWPDWIFRFDTTSYCVFGKGSGDTIVTNGGSDYLAGASGADYIKSAGSHNVLTGGSGNDHLELFLGSGDIYGGDGNDVIHDTVGGTIYGNGGDDFIETDLVAHKIIPGPGRDAVYGGIGDDTVIVYDVCELEPLEVLQGGFGNDTLVTPVSAFGLALRGVLVGGFENIIVTDAQRHLSECF